MPVLVSAGQATVPTYALLDSGASCNAITEQLALQIEAPIQPLTVKLVTFDEESITERPIATFRVTDLSQKFELKIDNALVGSIPASHAEFPDPEKLTERFTHLRGVNFPTLEDKTVGIIIGAKFAPKWMTGGVKMGKENEPFALLTPFGPALVGPLGEENEVENQANLCAMSPDSDENYESLSDQIRRLFRHDFVMRPGEIFPQETTHPSIMDEVSLATMKKSMNFDPDTNQYTVDLPWRYGRQKTAEIFSKVDFYANAVSRLNKLKIKFQRDPWLKEGSFAQVKETIKLGHSRVLTDLSTEPGSPVCYLPNLVVLHPDKPGKFRVCQDAAAKVKGHSLNKYLLSGPDNMNHILGVLTRCRRGKYVVTADIKNFFYMIRLNPKDAPALRYLWWTDETMTEIMVLEGTVHLFGIASSPSVATFTLRAHFDSIKHDYPQSVREVIHRSMYVDDLMHSFDDPAEGKMLKESLTHAVERGGFQLLKWKSNCPGITDPEPSVSSPPPPPAQDANTAVEAAAEETKTMKTNSNAKEEQKDPNEPEEEEETINELVERSLKGENQDHEDFSALTNPEISTKLLGIGYDYTNDQFFIKIRPKHAKEVRTKAEALSLIASVFDPLGFVGPFVLKSRIIFQRMNESGLGWKDKLPPELLKPLLKWRDSIPHLRNIRVPRWTSALGMEDSRSQLICFADASAEGYGCVAYLRKHLRGGGVTNHVSFLLSKCHVVPLSMCKKPVEQQEPHLDSIPRLELVAALSSTLVRDLLVRESGEEFEQIVMFSDSITVLKWIADYDRRFRTFENFRLRRIRSLTKLSDWRHIATKLNPADLCSKGIEAHDETKFNFLHSGPQFLREDEASWPPRFPENTPGTTTPEEKQLKGETIAAATYTVMPDEVMYPNEPKEMIISPFHLLSITSQTVEVEEEEPTPWPIRLAARRQTWPAKLRVIALMKKTILAWKDKIRQKKATTPTTMPRTRSAAKAAANPKVRMSLTREEVNDAELLLIRAIQSVHFGPEIRTLTRLNVFTPNALTELRTKVSKITNLSPFIDDKDVVRAGSRYAKADHLAYDTKFPIILPGFADQNVRSLIRHIHTKNMHCSRVQTHYSLKLRFFILGGRNAVNSAVGTCVTCQRRDKKPPTQRIGELPIDRVALNPPFAISGLDVFGPYPTKVGRRTSKRYGLMICCMVTRAVCLLPLRSLDSDAIVRALVKMNALFPGLKKIFSDNGSNFKGADREIREAYEQWKQKNVNDELLPLGIEWVFGPARCGSAGGAWERLIALSKNLLKSVVGNRVLEADTWEAYLYGAMAIMNRRPLTPASADVDDWMVLSPAHFLYPHLFTNSAPSLLPPAPGAATVLRDHWKKTRELIDIFWRDWSKTYLEELRRRTKWKKSTEGPKIGQVVLLVEENLPREQWRMGRITAIINADAQHPRRVLLKDAGGKVFDRHVTGIIPLELDAE